ncbi:hypothetical protein [Nocardioides soli]|uniref:Trypsin-like serine protease n=1 Tax=Nocardioides soli TaxID=1036020 RepID=A0A7W4Z3Y3_9ACTN|nr:hypothetical protein [Nocardioides soli]MBB3045573.1 hypothetical protein [Nocardioides soli]
MAAASLALAGSGVAWGEGGGTRPEPPPADSITLHDKTIDVTEALAANHDRAGFASVVVDEDRHVVTIRWSGEIPADIKRQAGDHDGVEVEVLPARYAEEELVAASRELMESNRNFAVEKVAGSDVVLPGIRRVGPNDDRSGLIVTLSPDAYKQREALSFGALTKAQENIPLTYEVDEAPAGVGDLGRTNDSAPWQGGGAINKGGHHSCTVGFAVLTSTGAGRLLGAGHCEDTGDTVNDGAGDPIGKVVGEKVNYDSILINPNAPAGVFATIGKVFTGGWSSNTSKYVGGAAAPSVGETICTSGANSGEHCDLTILQTSVSEWCDQGLGLCTGFLANGPGLNVATGDSGGPIYIQRSDGRVGARGVMNKRWGTPVTCSGIRYNAAGIECYTGVFSVGIHKVLAQWGVSIET